MKTSCISHPENERLVILRKWQVEACDGSHCAASILSYLEYWHNWKLDSDYFNKKANDISELHGEARTYSEDVMQYHTLDEIAEGILHLYGVKAITEALRLLKSKGFISIHTNPNKRYHYDKTKFFKFYPEVCQDFIKNRYKSRYGGNTKSIQQKGILDKVKSPNALSENALPYGENTLPITEINNKDKHNQSINTGTENFSEQQYTDSIKSIVKGLTEKGLPAKRFRHPDTVETLEELLKAGATVEHFVKAFEIASKATQGNFGINYLAKVVLSLLQKKIPQHYVNKTHAAQSKPSAEEYVTDLSGGTGWLDDLIDEDESI